MASLRGISKRVNLLQRRVYPSFGHRFGDDKDETKPVSSPNPSTMINKLFPHIGAKRLGSVSLERQYNSFVRPVGFGLSSYRYMSSTPEEFVAKKVVSDEILESVTSQVGPPAINEVAIAAADSDFPIAAIQHLINAVHSVTGLNWWADIVLTTLIINGLTIPLLLYQTKTFNKIDYALASDPEAMVEDILNEDKILYKKHGVNKTTLYLSFALHCYIFFPITVAIMNMAMKVPSFKSGGTLWFTDLTTADTTFTLHILTTLSFGILGAQLLYKDVREMFQDRGYVYEICLPLLVLSVLHFQFPQNAVNCYWLTSNLFFIGYGVVIRRPDVRKLLNLYDVTVSSTTPSSSSEMIKNSK